MSADQPAERSREESSLQAQPSAAGKGHLSAGSGIGVLFALLGGALAWGVLQAYYPVFGFPTDMQDLAGPSITADQDALIASALAKANRQNTIFALTVIGVAIGGALGIAEGVARRSIKSVLVGAIVVAIIGLTAGAGSGLIGDLTYEKVKPEGDPLTLTGTMLIQVAALSVLGAGIGLGLGALTGRLTTVGNCLVAGLLAGVGAGLLYPIILAFALPGAQTEWLVPISSGSRLLWIGSFAGLLGLIVPGAAGHRPSRSVAAGTTAATKDAH